MSSIPDRPLIGETGNVGDSGNRMKKDPFTIDLSFIDVETTGLTSYDHDATGHVRQYNDVIEVAVVRARQSDLTIVSEWSAKIKPRRMVNAQAKALEVNGYTAERWAEAVPLEVAMRKFYDLTVDTVIVAHNIAFDSDFIVAALKEAGVIDQTAATPWYNALCTMSSAQILLRGLTPRLRGVLVAETLGITPEPEVHGALNGARQCYQNYRRMRQIVDDPIIRARTEELVRRFRENPV